MQAESPSLASPLDLSEMGLLSTLLRIRFQIYKYMKLYRDASPYRRRAFNSLLVIAALLVFLIIRYEPAPIWESARVHPFKYYKYQNDDYDISHLPLCETTSIELAPGRGRARFVWVQSFRDLKNELGQTELIQALQLTHDNPHIISIHLLLEHASDARLLQAVRDVYLKLRPCLLNSKPTLQKQLQYINKNLAGKMVILSNEAMSSSSGLEYVEAEQLNGMTGLI